MKRLTPLLVAGVFGALLIAERRRPLRRRRDSQPLRFAHNAAMAALTALVTAPLQAALVRRALRPSGSARPGPLPSAVKILLLDYSLWWWHRLNHVWAPLWRFHSVHHADPDLDVSTGMRFHLGEMLPAALFRAAQVRLLGVDRRTLEWWQRMLLVSILFHHSNLRLPVRLERQLVRVLVTPRMHGIHHSDVEEQANSNWASVFSVWDSLHGTFVWDIPQETIRIGVPRPRIPAPPAPDLPPRPSAE